MEKIEIVLGKYLPEDIPSEFNEIDFFIKDGDEYILYANVVLPYLINHIEYHEFSKGDPRYFCFEGYEEKTKSAQYLCAIKPLGKLKGVYRVGLGSPFKIMDIEPLLEEKNILKK